MGVYSNDRTGLSGSMNVNPDTRYFGESALGLMLVEAQQNDMSMFDAIIRSDINESVSIREGTILESEITALQEGVIGNILSRIKEMLKKFLAKIKHIFDVFMAKITSITVVDGKKFIKMNEKRLNTREINKIMCKYRKPKYDHFEAVANDSMNFINSDLSVFSYIKLSEAEIEKRNEDATDADDGIVGRMLSASIGGNSTNRSDYSKDIMEYLFDDEDEVSVGSILPQIKDEILTGKKSLDGLKKARTKTTEAIAKAIKAFEKSEREDLKAGDKAAKDEDNSKKDEMYLSAKRYNLAAHEYSLAQSGVVTIINALMSAEKFNIAQSRRCYVRGCTNAKKEDAILNQMIEEAAEFDVMQSFEDFTVQEMA